MTITPASLATAGSVLTATQYNLLPRGVVAYATRTSNLSVTSTESDVTGLSVTFTAVAGRYYRYTVFIASADGDTNNLTLRVTDSSNVNRYRVVADQDGPAQFNAIHLSYVSTETAGSVTRKARAVTSTGGATLLGDATNVMWMLVEDIGEA